MTYKSPEFYAIERNLARHQAIKRSIDNARTFNTLKYAEDLTLTGKQRFDDHPISITISGDLMKAVLDLCASRSVAAANAIHCGEWEDNNFEKAAAV